MIEQILPVWEPPADCIHPLFGKNLPDDDLPRWEPQAPISRETKRLILIAYCKDKKTRHQVAKEFGVSKSTVDKALKGFRGSWPIPLYKVRRIYRLKHEDGMTPTPIAKRVGCSVDTVKKYLNLENPNSELQVKK